MNKTQLIELIARDAGISKAQAARFLNGFIDAIIQSLRKGEKVVIKELGTFSVSERHARNGRNPQTGEVIKIKAGKAPRFKAGKEFSIRILDPNGPPF